MHRTNPLALLLASASLAFLAATSGCGGGDEPNSASKSGSHDHDHDHDHDHEHDQGSAEDDPDHHHGETVELGEQTVGASTVKASRDGEVAPGGDVPIDVWIDGGLGAASAVRFWIGTQDAAGSVKAKAGEEDGHWHTHAEAPSPLPDGSMLWVEITAKDGTTSLVYFALGG